MNTIQYLTDPAVRGLFWPGVIAALAIALLSAPLSVLVVLKRLAFIGQGISHAAFGGIGLAAVLGLTARLGASGLTAAPMHGIPQFLLVTGFCVAAGLAVGVVADRRVAKEDTAIGVVLVASMALGAILLNVAPTGLAWESFLFGSITLVAPTDAATAWLITLAVLAALFLLRRPLLFWAFDEVGAIARGISAPAMRTALLILISLATVVAMKLAGVVLATALLVLPGATALALSRRWGVVLALSIAAALAGVVGGLVLSFEAQWPPGASIVVVLTALLGAARGFSVLRARARRAAPPRPA